MAGRIIGIDLGSLQTHVAVCDNQGNASLIPMPGGAAYPTWFAIDGKHHELVGHDARRQWARNPERTIYALRRLLGLRAEAAALRHWQARASYPITSDDDGNVTLPMHDRVITPEHVLTSILTRLRDIAAQHLQQPVAGAVITVPAGFGHRQRLAVRLAGKQAGLDVVRTIPEVAALALTCGARAVQSETMLLYRFGAGSFDAAVAKIGPGSAVLEAIGGDLTTGGLDLDHVLMMYLASEFEAKHGVSVLIDAVACQRLRDTAERIKRDLSDSLDVGLELPLITLTPESRPLDLVATVTREELNLLSGPQVDHTLDVVRRVLLEAHRPPHEIGQVLLVGGQSAMPLVRQRLQELFRKPGVTWTLDGAAAMGAAVYGFQRERGHAPVEDILTLPIGIQGATGELHEVFARNTPLPTRRAATFTTHRDGQRDLVMRLFEGDAHLGNNPELVGEFTFGELRAGAAGSVQVEVAFEVSDDGVIELSARDPETGDNVPWTMRYGVPFDASTGLTAPGAQSRTT